MLVLGLDVETTGLSKDTEEITEIGAILYDTSCQKPLEFYSKYLTISKPIPPMIVELTGITDDDCKNYGVGPSEAAMDIANLALRADAFMAHNAPFDRGFMEALWGRCEIADMPKIPWICTKTDIPYPKKFWSKKLEYLGPAHGFLNPWSHRAIFDVLTMLKVASHYDMENVLARSNSPKLNVQAMVRPPWEDEGKGVALAKEQGFSYDAKSKSWRRKILECELSYLKEIFPIKILEKDSGTS